MAEKPHIYERTCRQIRALISGEDDEIAVLAQSFSRMRASVVQAMKMLDE